MKAQPQGHQIFLSFQLNFSLSAHGLLREVVFLDSARGRPVGDPNDLGCGEQREVEWVGKNPGLRQNRREVQETHGERLSCRALVHGLRDSHHCSSVGSPLGQSTGERHSTYMEPSPLELHS